MEVFKNGTAVVDSAYEARRVGQIATFGRGERTNNVVIKHDGYDTPLYDSMQKKFMNPDVASNEVAFNHRTQAVGRIILDHEMVLKLRVNLADIIASGQSHRGISPGEADMFLGALTAQPDTPEEAAAPQPLSATELLAIDRQHYGPLYAQIDTERSLAAVRQMMHGAPDVSRSSHAV